MLSKKNDKCLKKGTPSTNRKPSQNCTSISTLPLLGYNPCRHLLADKLKILKHDKLSY